ncbi:MAG: methyltransferase domain-containing protein [Pseudomonadota bacterium]
MSERAPPLLFNPALIARNRARAAQGYDDYAFLKTRASDDLADRLGDVSRRFPLALDMMCHSGQAGRAMLQTGQVDRVIGLEPAPAFARQCDHYEDIKDGSIEHLPFGPAAFDLVTSVLGLHWANDLPGVLSQVRTVLKPDGLFLGCLFAGGTLGELRQCLIEAETEILGGVSPRISPLPSLQDMAGLMQRAGFALPVADIERITVRYDSPLKLMQDIKGMGEQAAFAARAGQTRSALSRRLLGRVCELYHARFADPDGRIRASFEIIWLSGWAPAASQPKPLRPGSARASLADAVKRAGKSSG